MAITPTGEIIKVPTDYWDKLKKRNIDELCKLSLAHVYPPEGLLLHFLNKDILLDMENRSIHCLNVNKREKIENPFLELIILVYLLNVSSDNPCQDTSWTFMGIILKGLNLRLKALAGNHLIWQMQHICCSLFPKSPSITCYGKAMMNLNRTFQFSLTDPSKNTWQRMQSGDL